MWSLVMQGAAILCAQNKGSRQSRRQGNTCTKKPFLFCLLVWYVSGQLTTTSAWRYFIPNNYWRCLIAALDQTFWVLETWKNCGQHVGRRTHPIYCKSGTHFMWCWPVVLPEHGMTCNGFTIMHGTEDGETGSIQHLLVHWPHPSFTRNSNRSNIIVLVKWLGYNNLMVLGAPHPVSSDATMCATDSVRLHTGVEHTTYLLARDDFFFHSLILRLNL